MLVRDVLKVKGNEVVSVRSNTTIAALSRLLTERNIGVVVVSGENSQLVGIISERDIIRGLGNHGANSAAMTADALMTRDVVTCPIEDSLDEVLELMNRRRVRHLPVMDGSKLGGFITMGDVLKYLWQEAKLEDAACQAYVVGVGYH